MQPVLIIPVIYISEVHVMFSHFVLEVTLKGFIQSTGSQLRIVIENCNKQQIDRNEAQTERQLNFFVL